MLRPMITASAPLVSMPATSSRLHAAGRRARHETAGVFEHELGDVFRVESIDVLARIDGADHGLLVDVFRRRTLDEDAVDGGIGIQITHDLQEFFLGGLGGQLDLAREKAKLGAGAGLRADIDLGRGVRADEHDGKAGRDAERGEGGGFDAAFIEHGGGDGFSIKDAGWVHDI